MSKHYTAHLGIAVSAEDTFISYISLMYCTAPTKYESEMLIRTRVPYLQLTSDDYYILSYEGKLSMLKFELATRELIAEQHNLPVINSEVYPLEDKSTHKWWCLSYYREKDIIWKGSISSGITKADALANNRIIIQCYDLREHSTVKREYKCRYYLISEYPSWFDIRMEFRLIRDYIRQTLLGVKDD